jgi:hypothetical protein
MAETKAYKTSTESLVRNTESGNYFTAVSSWGHVVASCDSGEVKGILLVFGQCDDDPDYYLPIIKSFDVQRYLKANKLEKMPDTIDILRFGFWKKDGEYEDPIPEYEVHREHEDLFDSQN